MIPMAASHATSINTHTDILVPSLVANVDHDMFQQSQAYHSPKYEQF